MDDLQHDEDTFVRYRNFYMTWSNGALSNALDAMLAAIISASNARFAALVDAIATRRH